MATPTYIPIATQTLGAAAASFTFSSIPSTYTDLRLVLVGTGSVNGDNPAIQFNGDTATNYSYGILDGSGTSAAPNNTSVGVNKILAGSSGGINTSIYTLFTVDIFSYAGSTNKQVLWTFAGDINGSGAVNIGNGLWRSTAAINSIKVFQGGASNYNTSTMCTLWGI